MPCAKFGSKPFRIHFRRPQSVSMQARTKSQAFSNGSRSAAVKLNSYRKLKDLNYKDSASPHILVARIGLIQPNSAFAHLLVIGNLDRRMIRKHKTRTVYNRWIWTERNLRATPKD